MLTGLAYHSIFLEHDTGPAHPERPERLGAIVDYLQHTGLWDRLKPWAPEPVDESILHLIHTPRLIDQVRRAATLERGWLDPDTVVSSRSFESALTAVGAVVEAVGRVGRGELSNALVLPRPPGHHATPDRAMGFCLFNNVALGAEWAIRERLAERVYVVDLDVHHGNGTQDAFYERADVLYFSVHQYPFYPGTGGLGESGSGKGQGYTVNVPLPAGCGDPTYRQVGEQVMVSLVERYRPDLVLVSLGFDAFWDDPLAGMRLSVGGYAALLRQLNDLAERICGGRLVIVLEGGYNLQALAYGIAATAHLLLGEQVPVDLHLPAPSMPEPTGIEPLIEAVRQQAGL